MTADLKELERLARAATPGPWSANSEHYSDSVVIVDSRGFEIIEATNMPILLGYAEKLHIPHWADKPGESFIELEPEQQAANAQFVAAANPAYILSLIAELEKHKNNLRTATNVLQSVLNGKTSPQLAQAVVNALNEFQDAAIAKESA